MHEIPPGLVVILGANGAGKTNFLEAIAVLGNVTSFRVGGTRAWVRRGEREYELLGMISHAERTHEIRQHVHVGAGITRSFSRNSRIVDTATYLDLFPVFTFSGEDRQLLLGPPALRRRFVDRLAFHSFPETLGVLQRYRHALRQRNALLMAAAADRQLDAFEYDLASSGARLCELRIRAIAALEVSLAAELDALEWSHSRVNVRYHAPGGEAASDVAVASRLRTALMRSRTRDRSRGYTLVGPHRHDLHVATQGTLARDVLSAGQGKLLVTALKLAAVAVLEREQGRRPTVIFDDVDAEFDVRALTSVLARLSGRGQVLVSSARGELILPRLAAAEVWHVRDGEVQHRRPEGRGA